MSILKKENEQNKGKLYEPVYISQTCWSVSSSCESKRLLKITLTHKSKIINLSSRLGQNVRVFSSSIQYLRQKGFCSNMYMLTQQSIMVTDFKTKLNLFTVQD